MLWVSTNCECGGTQHRGANAVAANIIRVSGLRSRTTKRPRPDVDHFCGSTAARWIEVSHTNSQLPVEYVTAIWNFSGSHQALTKMRKSASTSGVASGRKSGSVEPSMNNATLRADGSAQSSAVIAVPDGVNQRRSAASLPVR